MSDIFSHRFLVPLQKTNVGQNALSYTGPKLWNGLTADVKIAKNKNSFKHMKSNFFGSLKVS